MRKFLSSLGLETLLPPSLHSPFSSPNPSRPASPGANASRRSSSRSRTPGGDSKESTNDTANSVVSVTSKNPELVEIKALDWEYPASPFTQQQSSPRPLPFREHSSSSIITIKAPTPPSPHQRSRSRIRSARTPRRVASPDAEAPVPSIRITGTSGNIRTRTDELVNLQPLGVTQELIWGYRRHRGVSLAEGGLREEGFWKSIAEQGITGVKIPVECEGQAENLSELHSIISTAASYGLAILLQLVNLPLKGKKGESTPVCRENVYVEILRKHKNIIGLEFPLPEGNTTAKEPKEWYESVLQGLNDINTNLPIFVPVHSTFTNLESWASWIKDGREKKRWKNTVVMNIILETSLEGHLPAENSFKGIDWVMTTIQRPEEAETREGYGGWWSTNFDISNSTTGGLVSEHTFSATNIKETRSKAMKMRGSLKESALREFKQPRNEKSPEVDDNARKEVFQMGWEVGFVDAMSFWCGQREQCDRSGVQSVGLGLEVIVDNENDVDNENEIMVKAVNAKARIGLLNAWVERRTQWWVEVNKEKEKKKRLGCYGSKSANGDGGVRVDEFAEGVKRGVESFVKMI